MADQYAYNYAPYRADFLPGEWANEDSSQYNYRPNQYPASVGSSSITLPNPHQTSQYEGSHEPYYSSTRSGGYDGTPRGLDEDKEYTGTPVYHCLFHEVCKKSFYAKRAWIDHVDRHLPHIADRLPDYWPKAWQCKFPRCYERPFYDDDPFALWYRKLDHIASHMEAFERIETMPEEFSYLRIFRDLGLVSLNQHGWGSSTTQQFRNQCPGSGKKAPDFQQAQEMENWNMQKGPHPAQGPNFQDDSFRPGLSRSQTVPVNYINNPGYGASPYPPNSGSNDQQQYGRPPFEHHPISEPSAHQYPQPPDNYNYGHMPPPPPHPQYTG